MEQLSTYEEEIRAAALRLVPEPAPEPWREGAFIHAGGVAAAGWTADENVLLVSHDGYSVTTPSGSRLSRDPDPARGFAALGPDCLAFPIPGTHALVRVFGLCGGDGARVSADGWSVEVITPLWPRRWALLRRPLGPGVRSFADGATRLELHGLDEHDWLCAGFSPSGKHLLIASGSGGLVLSRT